MKIVLFANSSFAAPGLQVLLSQNLLAGLVVAKPLSFESQQLMAMAKQSGVTTLALDKEGMSKVLDSWLNKIKPEVVFVMTFPHKIAERTLDRMPGGFFNFHFSRLPHYRGANPVIWEMRNREENGAVSVHKMDSGFDSGPLAFVQAVPLHPEDSYGLFRLKLSQMGGQLILPLVQQLSANQLVLTPQKEEDAKYWPKPGFKDMLIDWNQMEASEIRALVKAGNPWNKGAMTILRGLSLKVVETTPVQFEGATQAPGTLLALSEENGLVVTCKNGKALRLEMVFLEDEGFLTGPQFMALGIQAGERFHMPQ